MYQLIKNIQNYIKEIFFINLNFTFDEFKTICEIAYILVIFSLDNTKLTELYYSNPENTIIIIFDKDSDRWIQRG